MNKKINFEDTLFILNMRIRMIMDTIRLDAEADIFLEKTIDDLEFINAVLAQLLDSLAKNNRLIERQEQLFNLEETEEYFGRLLAELTNGSGSISARLFPAIGERLGALYSLSESRKREIANSSPENSENFVDATVVSSLELNELLKDL